MKTFKIKLFNEAAPFVTTLEELKVRGLIEEIKALDIGDKLTIEATEHTPEELSEMPEWDGP